MERCSARRNPLVAVKIDESCRRAVLEETVDERCTHHDWSLQRRTEDAAGWARVCLRILLHYIPGVHSVCVRYGRVGNDV
jgi:hypothetical protein